jgi:hypothetical protein
MQSKLGAMLAQKEQELESLTATYSTTTAARDALISRLEALAASHAQMAQHESQARLAAESAAAKSEGERRVLEESYNALRSQLERDRAALREEAAAVKASVAEYRVAAEQEIGDIRSRAAREQAALVQEAEAHRARMEVAMEAASRAKESLATEHAATEARLQAHVRGQLADLEALAERHRVGLLTTLSAVEAERGLAAQAAQKREAELVSAAQAAQAALARQAEMHRQQMEAAVAAASEARSAAADAAAEREARLAAESAKLHASLMGQADAHRGHMERALQAAREEQALAEARAASVQADLQKRLEHAFEMQEAAAKEIVSAAEGYRLAAAMKHRLTDFERRLIAEQRRAATLERELESMLYGEGAAAAAEGRYLEAEHRHLLQLENGGQAPPALSPPGRSRAASANEAGRPRSARAMPAARTDATDYAAPMQSPVSPQRLQAVKGLARAASGSNGLARAGSPSRLDASGLRPVPEDRSLGSEQGPEAHRELLSPPRGRAQPAVAASQASSARSSRYGVMRPYESGLFNHVPNTPDLVADLSAPVAQALGLSRSLNVRLPEELPERLQQAMRSSRNAAAAAAASTRPSVSSSRVVPPGRDSLLREMRGSQMASAWEEVLSPQQQQRQQQQQQQRQRGRPAEEYGEEEAAAYEHEEGSRHTRVFASPSGSRGRAAHADAAARHRSASVGHVLRMRGSPPRDGYARHAEEEAAQETPAAGYTYSYVGQQAADLSPHRVRSTSVPSQRRPSDGAGRPAAGGSRGRHAQPAAGTAARVMAALDGVRTASAVASTAGGASAASPLVKALSRLSEEIHAAENRRLGREAPPYATELQPAAAMLRAGRTDLVGGSSAPQPSPGTRGNVRMTVTVTSRGQPAAGTPAPSSRAAAPGSGGPLADLGRPHKRQHSDDLSTQASVHSYDSERDGETDRLAASSGAGAMPTRVLAPVAAPVASVAAPLVLASSATRAAASQVPAAVALTAVQTAAAAAVVPKSALEGSNQELMVDIAALQAELAMLAQIGQEAEEAEAAVHGNGLSKTVDEPVAASVAQTVLRPVL